MINYLNNLILDSKFKTLFKVITCLIKLGRISLYSLIVYSDFDSLNQHLNEFMNSFNLNW